MAGAEITCEAFCAIASHRAHLNQWGCVGDIHSWGMIADVYPPRGGSGSTRRLSRSVFDRHEWGKEGESWHIAILLHGAESWDLWGLHNLKLSFVEAVKNMSSQFGWKRDLQLPMPLSRLYPCPHTTHVKPWYSWPTHSKTSITSLKCAATPLPKLKPVAVVWVEKCESAILKYG